MSASEISTVDLREDRFARLEAIEWWDQATVRRARVLVVGAGALGNEAIKNLALLGIGHLAIVDLDRIEQSNLCRSVLFRESDEGQLKAECAARAARGIYPEIDARAIAGNVLADVGLGYFRWADAVVGALDNREARLFVNGACARVGRPWIDGGIEALNGIVRGFEAGSGACYECTMSEVDWELVNKRRSCSLLARRAAQSSGTPTTPTTASIIGAIQVQEVVKRLHGLRTLTGRGYLFEGLNHTSYGVEYPVNPHCPRHDPADEVRSIAGATWETPLRQVWEWAADQPGGLDALDLSREIVEALSCAACGRRTTVLKPAESISAETCLCRQCGAECAPEFMHSIPAGSPLLERSARELGLPVWDLFWARRGEKSFGIELGGDAEAQWNGQAWNTTGRPR
jgi:adenylyltransferase/sulfurtransferase